MHTQPMCRLLPCFSCCFLLCTSALYVHQSYRNKRTRTPIHVLHLYPIVLLLRKRGDCCAGKLYCSLRDGEGASFLTGVPWIECNGLELVTFGNGEVGEGALPLLQVNTVTAGIVG